MKFKYILLTGMAMVLIVASCSEDFLTRASKSELTTGVYFSTQADFEAAVNGIYSPLRGFFNVGGSGSNTNTGPLWQIGDQHSDNARYYYNPNYRAVNESPTDFIPETDLFSNYWNSFYSWIARANQVLATIDNEGIEWESAAVKDNLKGQALFLRAYSYWWLAQLYGDVCIHISPVTSVAGASVPLSPRADVITLIKEDLTSASTLLLNKANQEDGRVTSGTAKMLLAEVSIWEKEYPAAETLLKSLSGEYSLVPDFADVFDPTNKNNEESIFEIQYDNATSQYASSFVYSMFPWPMGRDTVQKLTGVSNPIDLTAGEGYCIPTPDLIAEYEAGDERFDATIQYVWNANDSLVPMTVKFLHPHGLIGQDNTNLPIFRYAEALLFLAEAVNEQTGGRQDEAIGYINQVRDRAEMTGLPLGLSQQEVRDAILHERRVELAMEGKRFWDLVRYDILEDVITDLGVKVNADPIGYYLGIGITPAPTAFTDFRTKFNIPDDEIRVNSEID